MTSFSAILKTSVSKHYHGEHWHRIRIDLFHQLRSRRICLLDASKRERHFPNIQLQNFTRQFAVAFGYLVDHQQTGRIFLERLAAGLQLRLHPCLDQESH